MTAPDRFDPSSAPLVEVAPRLAAAAGHSVVVDVAVTHRGRTTEQLTMTVLGLDPEWVPAPLTVGPLAPGESTVIRLTLVPARGTLGAEYPFVVAVQAGRSTLPGALGTAESHLVVDALDRLSLTLEPQALRAVFSRKFTVQIGNPGATAREVELASSAAAGASVSLDRTQLVLQPGETVSVPGRARVTRPRIIGHNSVTAFSVTGRGRGAPHHVDGTLRSRPMLGGKLTGALILLLVVAVWAAGAIVLIPRLSQSISQDAQQQAQESDQLLQEGPSSGSAEPGADGSAAGGADGAEGEAGEGAGGAAGGDAPALPKLAGTVALAGPDPAGVTALLEPTTLAQAVANGAMAAPTMTTSAMVGQLRTAASAPLGKMASASTASAIVRDRTVRSTVSNSSGSFEFSDVANPGLYLLTLTKAGYQTQRFVIDADQLAAGAPLEVTLVPGEGRLSGAVAGPAGAVGAATITITDGTVSLQTSSVSQAETGTTIGDWGVEGLATPGTYLVTASSPGLGDSSALVSLDASGSAEVDLTLSAGTAQVTGMVSGRDDLDRLGGLGGLTVTATGASAGTEVERTTTTVTTGPVGTFVLPDLPVPGDYTITATGTGYVPVTKTLSLAADSASAQVDFSMMRSAGSVVGTVTGLDESGAAQGGLSGVGLSLVGQDEEFRTMSASDNPGVYRFAGVPPGTYVVSASQYGRRTSAATVTVTAAGTVTADLVLQAAANVELPADARIRGRVVDARTQGQLTCDRAAVPTVVCALTATVVPASGPDAGRILTTGAAPGEEYTLPSLLDTTTTGLVPGVYQVLLSAPGYESQTVSVQVAQGQIAPAPQVALQPLGVITGAVGTRVGTPSAASCVVLVPAGGTIPTTCAVDGAACAATGARCVLTADDGTFRIAGLVHGGYRAAVIPQDPEYRTTRPQDIQLELGGDFRYEPVLDRQGRIAVTVLRPDQQTLALSPATDSEIVIRPSAGGDPLGVQIGEPGTDGVRSFGRLTGVFTVTASGNPVINDDTGLDGPITVADNQTASATVILTRTIGAVVGRLTVNVDGEIRPIDNANVSVTGVVRFVGRSAISETATVVTDSNGCYAVLPADWPQDGPALSTPDCPVAVTDPAAIGTLDLVALPLSLSVTDNQTPSRVENHLATAMVIPVDDAAYVIPEQLLQARPSDATGSSVLTVLAPQSSTLTLTSTTAPTFVINRKPAAAGAVSVAVGTVDPAAPPYTRTETLIWRDASLSAADQLVPGRYTLTVTRPGFTAATLDLWCDLGLACIPAVFGPDGKPTGATAPPFVQKLLPAAAISVEPPVSMPAGVLLTETDITLSAQPVGADTRDTVGTTGAVTLYDETLRDPLLTGANLLRPGRYELTVALRGFQPRSGVVLLCGNDFEANGAGLPGCLLQAGPGIDTTAQRISLEPLPTFSGSVTLAGALPVVPGQPTPTPRAWSEVTVAVSPQANPTTPITASVVASATDPAIGTIVWNDPTQPLQIATPNANYTLQFTADGYAPRSVSFGCSFNTTTGLSECSPSGTVTLTRLPELRATLQLDRALPTGLNWTDAVVRITNTTTAPGTFQPILVETDRDTAELYVNATGQAWPGLVPTGVYTIQVTLTGYGTFSSTFNCVAGATCGPVVPGDPNDHTMTLTSLPVFSGTLTLAAQPPSGVQQTLTGVTLTAVDKITPSRQITLGITDTSSATSELTWQETGQPAGLVAESTYTVTAVKQGYRTGTIDLQCSKTGGCSLGTLALQLNPIGAGTITLNPPPPNGQVVDWTKVVVSQTSAVAGTEQLKVRAEADPAAPAGTTQGRLVWSDPTLGSAFAGTTRPGTYTFSVTVPGYAAISTAAVACIAGQTCAPTAAPTRMSAFSGTVSLDPSGGDLSAVSVSVVSGAVSGREPTVTVDDTGKITWTEPGQPEDLMSSGTYTLRFSLSGYTTQQPAPLNCAAGPSGPAPTCALGNVVLGKLPSAGGSVTVTSGAAPNWTDARVRVTSAPTGSAVTIELRPTDPADPLKRRLQWTDSTQPAGVVTNGNYDVELTLPGFAVQTLQAVCSIGGSCSVDFTPQRLPVFAGTVRNSPAVEPVVATVLVQAPAGIQVSVGVASNGALTWQQSGLPTGSVTPGTYVLTASATGYLPAQPLSVTCTMTGCDPVALVLTKSSALQVLLVDFDSPTTALNGGTVTLTGDGATSTTTLTAPAGSNSVSFPGKDPSEQFTADIGSAGYERITVNSSSTQVTCVNGAESVTGLAVLAGGTTSCTVRLKKLGTLTGTVGATFVAPGGTATSTLRQLGDIPVTVQRLAESGGTVTLPRTAVGPSFSAVSSATAPFSITGTAATQGLLPGYYEIKASANGYDPFVGTVLIDATNQVVTSGLTDAVPVGAGGAVSVVLKVKPVAVQLRLLVGGVADLPGVVIRMTGERPDPVSYTCTLVSGACTSTDGRTDNGTAVATPLPKHVRFTGVLPGIYDVEITSPTNTYRPIHIRAELLAGVDPAVVQLSTDTTASGQTGKVLHNGGNAVGATVSLRPVNSPGTIALDANGTPLTTTTNATGDYTFSVVPQGSYVLVATLAGFVPFNQTVALDSGTGKVPATITIATTRATRVANLTVGTTAAGSPSLSGSSLSLTLGAETQSNLAISAAGAVSVPSIATGTWTTTFDPAAAAGRFPFGADPDPTTVEIPDLAYGATATPVAAALTLKLARVKLQVTWPTGAGTCTGYTAPASGTMLLDITKDGTTHEVSAVIGTATATSQTAEATVYLPPGSYTFAPKNVAAADWTATDSDTILVDSVLTAPAEVLTPAITLTPTRRPVDVTVTGSGSTAPGLKVTSGSGAGAVTATVNAGAAQLCLAPGAATFALSTDDPGTLSAVPSKAETVAANGSTTVAFTAYRVTPRISEESVTGRTADTTDRTVALTIEQDGENLLIEPSEATIPGGSSAVDGPSVLVGPGDLTITATPAGAAFGANTDTVFDPADGNPQIDLPYQLSMVTVTVNRGSPPVAVTGATVTVNGQTPVSGTLFRDVTPGAVTVVGSATISGDLWSGTTTGTASIGTSTVTLTLTPPTPPASSSPAPSSPAPSSPAPSSAPPSSAPPSGP